MTAVRYLCDDRRHLVCLPYSVPGLHAMAEDLGIGRWWFHGGRWPHYDIPKGMLDAVRARCEVVSPREIVRIIREAGAQRRTP